MKKYIVIIILMTLACKQIAQGQAKDSLLAVSDSIKAKNDSIARAKMMKKKLYAGPHRAAVLSAFFPGLGQAYNKKYWKMPIIYAGIGGFAYLFAINNKQYNFYRKNLIAANDADSNTINTTRYGSSDLETLKLQYKKSRDFAVIAMGLIYLFNIIDANVDGHLKTFDVSDDLSIHIDPWQSIYRTSQSGYRTATGLSIKINFN